MSKHTEELEYFSEFQKNCKCSECGEGLHDAKCIYCGAEIEHAEFIIESVKEIISSLPKENVEYSTDINLLYKMRNIDVVEQYIKQIGYDEILVKKKQEIFSKDYNSLTDKEIKSCEFLTEYFLSEDEKTRIYNDALFVRCLNNQNRYSFQFIEKAYLSLVEKMTKESGLNGTTNVIDFDKELKEKGTVGTCSGLTGGISIDRQGIIDLCNGDPDVFATLFHEMRHREQNRMIYGKINNQEPAVLLWAKENILSKSLPGYYKTNYNIISFETDAFATECMSMINMPFASEDKKNKYREKMREIQENDNNWGITRIYEGKTSTVEELFDEHIKMTDDILERIPIFNYQYIKDDETGKIRHRTIEEINEYIDKVSNDKTNVNGQEMLKNYLISFEKVRTEGENIESNGIKKV